MRRWTSGLLAAIATLVGALSAEAASIPITIVTPAVLLADFNVIVQNNLTNSNDVQGPVLVGCPATGCLSTQGLLATGPINSNGVVLGTTPGTTGINGYGAANVFSNVLSGTNASVNNSMTLVGGTKSGTLSNTGVGSVLGGYVFPTGSTVANNPTTFQTFVWSPLTSLSTSLGTFSANSTFSGNTFTGVNGPNGAVFDVTLAQLQSAGTLTLAGCLAGATPCDAVINVSGAGTLNNPSLVFPLVIPGLPNIIVNFENAVTLTVGNVWTASILDPLGSVVGMHEIDGNVVAMSFSTSDETHFVPFDCSDNLCGMSGQPTDVPEPGSLALLSAGLGAFAVIRRRRA